MFVLQFLSVLFYRQSGTDLTYREIVPDGLYLEYCSFGTMRDMVKVCHYHDKTICRQKVVVGAYREKSPDG